MGAITPLLNAVVVIFTFDGGVHLLNHEGKTLHHTTIDPLVVRTNNILPALNTRGKLSVFGIDGQQAFPLNYKRDATANPTDGLMVVHDHLFMERDTSEMKKWAFPFLPLGSLEVLVTKRSASFVRMADWKEEFYVSVSDVSLLSLKGPPDNLARSLFVGHDRLFTTNWNVQFYAPIRSVFVQTAEGTHELVGSQTMWTIVCQDKSCSPVVVPENTNGRELRVVEPEIERAFVVTDTDGTNAWGVLENPIIRVEDGFTHWPSLPPPTEVRHIPRAGRMKRRWIFGGFLLISWLLFSFLRSFYTRRLRFFYSSPIVSQDLTRIQLLDVEKEMSGLLAVPAVASLDRIRDAAMQGGFIHLSCHTLKDQFVLENRGVSVLVSSEQMVAALDGACFVFLAGCDTWTTAQKLKSVSFAVGTVGVVKDKDIRLFAQCFYKELYAHQSIENSFRRAQLLAGCDASAFQLHIGNDQPCCGSTMKRLGNILTLGICQRLVPRLRPTDTTPHLDFGMDDVVGREKEMVAVAKLFAVNERRITVIEGYSAFRFVKQFVSYFSLPGRLFPRVIFLRSSIPPIDKAYDLIVLEPQVEPHVVKWIVENWPPWERCHLLTTGAVLPSLQDASIECKVCRYKLEALQPQRSVELFLRRVHRPLRDNDFKIEHESLSERLLTHPIVGPVLQRGDPDAVIRLAQQVSTSLPSLYDLRDEKSIENTRAL